MQENSEILATLLNYNNLYNTNEAIKDYIWGTLMVQINSLKDQLMTTTKDRLREVSCQRRQAWYLKKNECF